MTAPHLPPPPMPEQPTVQLRLRIWQQNINRSMTSIQHILNSNMHLRYDVIALQEPYLGSYSNTRASRHWRVVYPTTHLLHPQTPHPIQSCSLTHRSTLILGNRSLSHLPTSQSFSSEATMAYYPYSIFISTVTIVTSYRPFNPSPANILV